MEDYLQDYFYSGGDILDIGVISELIRVTRNKGSILLFFFLVLLLLLSGKMTGATIPSKRSNLEIEDVLKFNSGLVREALLITGFSTHRLNKGETLYCLSQKYYVSVADLMKINKTVNPHLIPVGEKLYIPPVDYKSGRLKRYLVKPGDTLNGLLSRFGLELWQFKRINPDFVKQPLEKGTALFLPKKKANHYSRAIPISVARPIWGRITSRFGRRWGRLHSGIDLAAPIGAPIRAAASGQVTFSGWNGGYGWFIKLNHGKFRTNYGHLSKIMVRKDSYVQEGDLIGLVGSTGRAFGSHLHFEIEINGVKVDPILYLRKK